MTNHQSLWPRPSARRIYSRRTSRAIQKLLIPTLRNTATLWQSPPLPGSRPRSPSRRPFRLRRLTRRDRGPKAKPINVVCTRLTDLAWRPVRH